MKTENYDLEYKEMYVDDINKEVIAFSNTEGGTLYIGIRKDGTGVRKIMDLYRYFERKPEFESAQGAFRVTLYNMNCAFEQSETDLERIKQNEDERNRIIDAVRESGSITRKDVEILLWAGQTKAYSILNELVMNGQLVRIRAGKKTIYQLAE